MEIVKALNSYCLTKDGISLTMQFGIAENACGSKERWRFYGANIPMPVRSGTWFQGLSVREMLSWLSDNGWTLHSYVNLCSGIIHPCCKGNEAPNKGNENHSKGNEELPYSVKALLKKSFEEILVYLYKNDMLVKAVNLYRYVNGGRVTDALSAVREIVALDEKSGIC